LVDRSTTALFEIKGILAYNYYVYIYIYFVFLAPQILNSQVGESLVGLCHQGWRPLAEELPRALREAERLTRNPESWL